MKREVKENIKEVMTFEVDTSAHLIRQARGRFNHAPNKKAMEIMKKWVNKEGFKIGLHMQRIKKKSGILL